MSKNKINIFLSLIIFVLIIGLAFFSKTKDFIESNIKFDDIEISLPVLNDWVLFPLTEKKWLNYPIPYEGWFHINKTRDPIIDNASRLMLGLVELNKSELENIPSGKNDPDSLEDFVLTNVGEGKLNTINLEFIPNIYDLELDEFLEAFFKNSSIIYSQENSYWGSVPVKIQRGDNLYRLSKTFNSFGADTESIIMNNIDYQSFKSDITGNTIKTGDILNIPILSTLCTMFFDINAILDKTPVWGNTKSFVNENNIPFFHVKNISTDYLCVPKNDKAKDDLIERIMNDQNIDYEQAKKMISGSHAYSFEKDININSLIGAFPINEMYVFLLKRNSGGSVVAILYPQTVTNPVSMAQQIEEITKKLKINSR